MSWRGTFNQICRVHECSRWRTADDVVCKYHYKMLPRDMQKLLYSDNPNDHTLALEWIDEHEGSRSIPTARA